MKSYMPLDAEMTGVHAWANVLRHGEGEPLHHHEPTLLTGVYHVSDNESDAETVLYRPGFLDRGGASAIGAMDSVWNRGAQFWRRPQAGTLVVFPSYLRHEVRPNLGRTPRISIPFDVEFATDVYRFEKPWWRPCA